MLDTFMEMMSYPFMVRAFLVGSLVALCSALLGVSLVLKRYSMIGDGLSCWIRGTGHRGCAEHGAFGGCNSGGRGGCGSASSHQRQQQDQRRCGNCTDFYGSTGDRDYGDFDDDRNEH